MSATKPDAMTYERLKDIVSGPAAAIRLRTKLHPAGGPGDKVFPPTYSGGIYACEDRRLDGRVVHTVVLDSVQSQANRFELALLGAYREGQLRFPLIKVDFSGPFPDLGEITSLEVPHRSADAIIRDSVLFEKPFPNTDLARRMMDATVRNATALFEYCPTALIFGTWDSTGARGGMGNKFARCVVSEIVAFETEVGFRTSSRIDPLGIERVSLYESTTGEWTALASEAKRDEKKNPVLYKRKSEDKGKPSEINHGNVTPDLVRGKKSTDPLPGGVTMAYALQTTVLSLPGLRRLGFPDATGKKTIQRDAAAHLTLAALTLAAFVYQRELGYDLRSRCVLVPEEEPTFEVVTTTKDIEHFALSTEEAKTIFASAVDDAKEADLPWHDQPVVLKPKKALIDLIMKSREVELTEEAS
jgi:CRISPR-associated protein Csb1